MSLGFGVLDFIYFFFYPDHGGDAVVIGRNKKFSRMNCLRKESQ